MASTHIEITNRILRDVPLIDGHNDWLWNVRNWFLDGITPVEGRELGKMPIGQTDLERLQSGQLGGQFWSAFVPSPRISSRTSDEADNDIIKKTLQQIDLIHRMIEMNPEQLGIATTVREVWEVFRSGRLACLIGIEGLHQIGKCFSALRAYHSLGVRYITLTHIRNNSYADSATAETEGHGGLSKRGIETVEEMNRIGLIVDLSHTSEEVQEQVLNISRAPVIFSHSSCSTLTPNKRNVNDKVLDMLKQNDGIIMICFLPELVKPRDGGDATIAHVTDHIIYAGQRIGYSHVGIGSDFDGMLKGPDGLDEVSQYPALIRMLLDRGVSEENVKQVAGLNILRVLGAVGEVATQLRYNEKQKAVGDFVTSSWSERERQMVLDEGIRRRERRQLSS